MNGSFEYQALAPIIVLLTSGVLSLLIEAFAPRTARRPLQLILVGASILLAFAYVVINSVTPLAGDPAANGGQLKGLRQIVAQGSAAIDGPGLFMQGTLLLVSFVAALLMAERSVDPQGDAFTARASALPGSEDERQFTAQGWLQTEIWPLFLFSVGGMLLFPVANDFVTMFVALEVFSLPLYLMASMARRRRLLSQEAALKYFILGSFSSAFFLFGSALIYAATSSVNFSVVTLALESSAQEGLIIAGIGLIAVGLLFKVSAVPFHQWTPDVYQGSPTPLTAFMGSATKIAAFGALLRVFYVAFGGMRWDWRPLMWVIAALTMIIGSILAVTQTDIKRMLAFSSVSHAGFLLLGVIATSAAGLSSTMFYLFTYGFTTLGAFAIVSLVRDASGEATHLSQWAGLGKKSPWIASTFALFLLALAGIPLTSGFTGKFAIFTAAIDGGATPLVIVAVVASAVAAFFYARVIVLMFFTDAPAEGPSVIVPSSLTTIAIGISAAVTVLLGIAPQPVLNLVINAGLFVR
ncbi:MAG: NADH-quinone oxidoreductase subunit NuoN [Actinomycetes bacterium]|jgi:NADH-quinone oxidoreductase subunit N